MAAIRGHFAPHGGESAREVFDRRFASGEIDDEEYRRLRAALSNAPAPPPPVQASP
jgi:uncharacterized membrane protein